MEFILSYLVLGFFVASVIVYSNKYFYRAMNDKDRVINFVILWVFWLPIILYLGLINFIKLLLSL